MYSWEIQNFLKERNYYIGGDDLLFILDTKQHPQLTHIQYNCFNNMYEMWDRDGNYFCFTPIPYEETKEKQLIKTIWKK